MRHCPRDRDRPVHTGSGAAQGPDHAGDRWRRRWGPAFCAVRLVWKKGAGDGIRASSALVLRCLPDEVVPGASSVKMKHHFDKPPTAVRLALLEAPDCAPRRDGPGVVENEMPEEL